VVEGRTFRCHTVDISLGGLKLEKKVPWKVLDKVCEVYLAAPDAKDKIRFRARVVQSSSDARSIAFVDCDDQTHSTLDAWIINQRKYLESA
jgi:hypothetical protein